MNTPPRSYILAFDIGGSNIRPHLFEAKKTGMLSEKPASAPTLKRVKPAKGYTAHLQQMNGIFKAAVHDVADLGGHIVAVAVGIPGRFDAKTGNIKPGTNTNMEPPVEHMDAQARADALFDNKNLRTAYIDALPENNPLKTVPFYVYNDGNAMLAGMMDTVQRGTVSLKDAEGNEYLPQELKQLVANQYVGLLGIGTGIGHAIIKLDERGEFTCKGGKPNFITDGHASKLWITVDEQDWDFVETAKDKLGKNIVTDGHKVRAEDLCRGPALEAMAGVEDKNWDMSIAQHRATLQFAGKYMARLIQTIRSGESTDVTPANGWTEEEKSEAAKTSVYFVGGGGFGISPAGAEIVKFAREELHNLGIEDITLVHYDHENNAARAAASMVPKSEYCARGTGTWRE